MDRTACTEPHCLYNGALYHYLFLCSPYGPYGFYRATVLVQECTLTLPIYLYYLWTVESIQSLSACETVHFPYTYTSKQPMGCAEYTEPQCLYKCAL